MKLSQLRREMREYAKTFDPALVSARDAERIRNDASAIKKAAVAVEAGGGASRRDERLEEERRAVSGP